MKFDPMTLMWIQVATGAFGTLTLVFAFRWMLRKLGFILEIRAFFSPKGGCQEAIVAELKKARREILVQAYSFTADPLTFALVEAKKNGVAVEIVLRRLLVHFRVQVDAHRPFDGDAVAMRFLIDETLDVGNVRRVERGDVVAGGFAVVGVDREHADPQRLVPVGGAEMVVPVRIRRDRQDQQQDRDAQLAPHGVGP